MSDFQPPPTYAEVVLVDPRTNQGRFNPIWLNWFIGLAQFVNSSGGSAGVSHNDTGGLQGGVIGSPGEFYHLTKAQHDGIVWGTYTPTLTNVLNITASTAHSSQWLQQGNGTILVSGMADVDPTAAGSVQLGISLPIASNLTNNWECAGTAFCKDVAGQGAAIIGDAANDRAQMEWIAVDVASRPMHYLFAYRIL